MSRFFPPVLAGASLFDRVLACLGALAGIAITALICRGLPVPVAHLPMLVAPMGASAVLLFAVPASPLAQPWAIIGGNVVSATVGIAAALTIPDPTLSAGVAVGGAILAMSLCRCLHPPGGAAALTAVIGGPAVLQSGFLFPFMPVALNSILLVATGWLFHHWSSHSYPHRPKVEPADKLSPLFLPQDLDQALTDMGETLDVSREDLDQLIRRVEHHAALRSRRAANFATRTLAPRARHVRSVWRKKMVRKLARSRT